MYNFNLEKNKTKNGHNSFPEIHGGCSFKTYNIQA